MISRSTRRGLVIAAGLAVLTWWLAENQGDGPDGPIEGLDTRLDYALQNFEMQAFDEEGNPAMHMWSPRLTNDATTRIGRVESPRIELRYEGYLWYLQAESAIISEGQDEVFLAGRVRLDREGSNPLDALNIDTSDVMLLVDNRVASSDGPVRISDSAGVLSATGFRVDMITNEFQLDNNVQGAYVTTP